MGAQTIYDGVVTGSNINQYLSITNNVGFEFKQVPKFEESQDGFSLLMWFRMDEYPWNLRKDMDLLNIGSYLTCQIQRDYEADCYNSFSIFRLSLLQNNQLFINLNEWYLLVLSSKDGASSLTIYDQSFQSISSKSNSFRPYDNQQSMQDFYFGADRYGNNGLHGSVRQVQVFGRALQNLDEIKEAAFSFVTETNQLYFQATFRDLSKGLVDSVSKIQGQPAGKDTERNIKPQVDFESQFFCWYIDPSKIKNLVKFENSGVPRMKDLQVSSTGYRTVLYGWIMREKPQNSYSEILFQHQDVQALIFTSSGNLSVQHLGIEQMQVEVPFDSWVWIVSWHDQNNFGIHVEDLYGKVYSDGMQSRFYLQGASSTSYGSQIKIGQYFQGYILGLKYFQGSKPDSFSPVNFNLTEEQDAIFYFSFQKDGLLQGYQDIFRNLVRYKGYSYYGIQSFQYIIEDYMNQVEVKQVGDKSLSTIKFDGIACNDDQKKLFFENSTNFASSEFSSKQDLRDITIELWFKPSDYSSQRSRNILEIQKNGQTQVSITKNYLGELLCAPLFNKYQQNKYTSLDYFNFDDGYEGQVWNHISCVIDSKNKRMIGTLYTQRRDGTVVDLKYGKSIESFVDEFKIQADVIYEIVLNSKSLGMQNTYFADVRLWNYARSLNQIRFYRNKLLDYKKEVSYLLSSMQLLGGGRSKEYDYAQFDSSILTYQNSLLGQFPLKKEVKFDGQSWQQESSLTLCPVYTFFNSKKCQRDSLISANLILLKKEQNYTLTSRYSQFVTNFDYHQNFNFNWKFIRSITVEIQKEQVFRQLLETQKSQEQVSFMEKDLQLNGGYEIEVEIRDNQNKQELITKMLRITASDCIQFHDKSGEVEVFIEHPYEKGEKDIRFDFEIQGCTKLYYKWDAKLSYKFLNPNHLPLNNRGIRFQDDTSFIIDIYSQYNFPVNEDITVILSANWNDKIVLSIVYTIRFNTMINLQIEASNIVIPSGETLTLSTKQSQIINYPGDKSKNLNLMYEVVWKCPEKNGQKLCQSQDSLLLSQTIHPDDFKRVGLSYWTLYTFEAIAQTYFIQGDDTQFRNKSIQVQWIPFNPDATILNDDISFSDQITTLRIKTNGINDDKIIYNWTVYPEVNSSSYINGNQNAEFAIAPNYLLDGITYSFYCQIILLSTQDVIWQGFKMIKIEQPPNQGKLVIEPYQGKAFDTIFSLQALDWVVRYNPPEYQFMYQNDLGSFSVITPYQVNNRIYIQLPPTRKIILKVRDQQNTIFQSSSTIYVKFNNETAAIKVQETLFNESNLLDDKFDLVVKMSKLSLLTNNYNKFSSFRGFQMSKGQIKQIINYLDYFQKNGLMDQTDSDIAFFAQSSAQIFGLITRIQKFYDIDQAIVMQEIVHRMLNQTYEPIQQLFQKDIELFQSIVLLQSNILNGLDIQTQRKEIPNLIYGYRDSKVMNITHNMRHILTKLERFVGMGLKVGETAQKTTEFIDVKIEKLFGKQDDFTINSEKMSYKVPMSSAKHPTGSQSLTQMVFKYNPFYGSNYPHQTQGNSQETVSNHSVYISWRDEEGNYLNSSHFGGKIEIEFDYNFQTYKLNKSLELKLTHCMFMGPNKNEFGTNACETVLLYEQNKVKCSCTHMSYYTVGRHEFIQPLSEAQGNFDFKNWASFSVFSYLILLLIFGMILTQNMDNRDIAKLNDMDIEEQTQYAGLNHQQIQFPLQAFALKRQVYLMDFVEGELQQSRLFFIFMSQFHPMLTFKFRFDPLITRQDRFVVLFLQISVSVFVSFMAFRNLDKPDLDTGEIPGLTKWAVFKAVMSSFLFSIFMINPLPSLFYDCLRTRYALNEAPDEEEIINQNGFFNTDLLNDDPFGGLNQTDTQTERLSSVATSTNLNKRQDENADLSLYLDPNIPLSFLFQIGAFSLEYLKKKGTKRFTFLEGERKDVGIALEDIIKQQIQKEAEKPKVAEAENRTQRRTQRRRGSSRSRGRSNSIGGGQNMHRTIDTEEILRHPVEQLTPLHVPKIQIDFLKDSKDDIDVDILPTPSDQPNRVVPSAKKSEEYFTNSIKKIHKISERASFIAETEESQRELFEVSYSGPSSANNQTRQTNRRELYLKRNNERKETLQKEGGNQERSAPTTPENRRRRRSRHMPSSGRNSARSSRHSSIIQPSRQNNSDEVSSVNSDNMQQTNKEFVEDPNHKKINRSRLILYLVNAALLITVLIVYSLEEIHARGGRATWVLVFFFSQLISILITSPVWIAVISAITFRNQDDKVFLSKHFYDQLVLLEDYNHVLKFQSQKFG